MPLINDDLCRIDKVIEAILKTHDSDVGHQVLAPE